MHTSIKYLALALAVAACDQGAPTKKPGIAAAATVTLTAVTFADDCGGTPPATPPPAPAKPASVAPPARREAAPAAEAIEKPGVVAYQRRCEQTSLQLSVVATKDTEVSLKRVEVFDEKGVALGVLTTSSPTRWAEPQAAYQPWDGKIAAGQTASVSYVLQQPSFVDHYADRSRTYTVKVLASVGGTDQPLQTSVMVIARPPPVPT